MKTAFVIQNDSANFKHTFISIRNPQKFGINLDKDLHFDTLRNVFNSFGDNN